MTLSLSGVSTVLWHSLVSWVSRPVSFLFPLLEDSLPLYDCLTWVFLASCLFCLAMYELTGNLSQVDRLWSILPPVYSTLITLFSSTTPTLTSPLCPVNTMFLMSLITAVWGARLTYQFYKKGGYTLSGEDYRWRFVREVLGDGWVLNRAFNLFFVVIYQNVLLFLLVLPQLLMLECEDLHITVPDVVLTCTGLGLVAMEATADAQQQHFQRRKYKAIAEGGDLSGNLKAGFLREGLFAYCRHPNFVAEVLIWWNFALFTAFRFGLLGSYWIGAINLTLLFCGSQDLTEQISARKYPDYVAYQKHVPSYIPNLRMMSIK